MKRILLILILLSSLLAAKKCELTKKDLEYIKNSPKKSFIINRFKAYKAFRKKAKNLRIFKKLSHVNAFFNRILPVDDKTKFKSDDYWATRKEFMIEGRGDCEDYAIAKYFTLLELGVDPKELYLCVVKVKGATSYHMVLLYIKTPSSMPLVLDNLSFKVVPFNKRKDLIPKFAFNEYSSHIFENKILGKKVNIDWGKVNKWEKLLDRVYNKKE